MTQEAFKAWWYNEGSQAPYTHHDCEEHTMRMCEIAWNEAVKAEQEPVAWINAEKRTFEWNGPVLWNTPTVAVLNKIPLYTHPPQRTWVGLTEQDLDYLCNLAYTGDEEFALAVQAKLMEKNA